MAASTPNTANGTPTLNATALWYATGLDRSGPEEEEEDDDDGGPMLVLLLLPLPLLLLLLCARRGEAGCGKG